MNLTATETESPGFLRLTPSGREPAETSNVNFFAGDTVPNLVICKLGADGRVTLDSAGDGVHALGDVFGYFGEAGDRLRAVPPSRLLDTRDGTGGEQAPLGPNRTATLIVGGRGQVPENATAVVLNVAATSVAAPSFLAVWPAGETRPDTSNLNMQPGQTVANLVVCRLGTDGAIELTNPIAECDAIADVMGYFVS
jgi:hypothetical protein